MQKESGALLDMQKKADEGSSVQAAMVRVRVRVSLVRVRVRVRVMVRVRVRVSPAKEPSAAKRRRSPG